MCRYFYVSVNIEMCIFKLSAIFKCKWSLLLPFSSSCLFSPTDFGLPRPLRMGSDWLLALDRLLFSMSLVKWESILSLRMRSVLLRLKSNLSEEGNKDNRNASGRFAKLPFSLYLISFVEVDSYLLWLESAHSTWRSGVFC